MGVARRFASGQWCEAPSKPPLRAIELQSLAGGSSINARYATSIRPPPEVWLMVSTTVALTCARLQCGSGGHMSKSRRQFLARTSLGLLGAAAAGPGKAQKPAELPPGAPPAFGAAPAVGPEVSPSTFAEAEKLMQVELTGTDRAVAAGSWRTTMAPLYERRAGPRKVGLEPSLAYSQWDPVLPGQSRGPARDRFIRTKNDPGQLPATDADIAFAPIAQTLALDRAAKTDVGEAYESLPGAACALRSETALRNHAHARVRAHASQAG